MNNVNNLTHREIWDLDLHINEKPDNHTIVRIVNFLSSNPTFIQEYPHEAKSYWELIETADLVTISDDAWKAYSLLLKNHPTLFRKAGSKIPLISIKIGKKEAEIPKNSCLAQSRKFRALFRTNNQESKKQLIEIDSGNYDEKSIDVFLLYLEKGQVLLDGDNVWDLYLLADEHDFFELKESCIEFLAKYMDVDNWESIVDLSLRTNNHQLLLECCKFAVDTEEKHYLEKIKEIIRGNQKLIRALLELVHISEENLFLILVLTNLTDSKKITENCKKIIDKAFESPKKVPALFKKAVDLNLKEFTWVCLLVTKYYQINLLDNQNLKKSPYEEIAAILKFDKIYLQVNTGHLTLSPFFYLDQNFTEIANALKSLSIFFDITLHMIDHNVDLKNFKFLIDQSIPFTYLHMKVTDCNEEHLIPLLKNSPGLKGFCNLAKGIHNYEEFVEYANHFYPLNENSQIHLTGFSLNKDFSTEELEKIFNLSPNLEFLSLHSWNLEELVLPSLPKTIIQIIHCPNLKDIKIENCATLDLLFNEHLSSVKINQKDWEGGVLNVGCDVLKNENIKPECQIIRG